MYWEYGTGPCNCISLLLWMEKQKRRSTHVPFHNWRKRRRDFQYVDMGEEEKCCRTNNQWRWHHSDIADGMIWKILPTKEKFDLWEKEFLPKKPATWHTNRSIHHWVNHHHVSSKTSRIGSCKLYKLVDGIYSDGVRETLLKKGTNLTLEKMTK